MTETPADWTLGQPGLVYENCTDCGRNWYFQRGFCPHCGSIAVAMHPSACLGTIHAVTVVERAPSPEWKTLAPYGLALIDLDEGVRVMAHAQPGMAIGTRVKIGFRSVGQVVLPFAGPLDST